MGSGMILLDLLVFALPSAIAGGLAVRLHARCRKPAPAPERPAGPRLQARAERLEARKAARRAARAERA